MENPSVFDNCVLLSLTLHCLGNSAKGDMDEVETGADKKLLKLSKQLMDCEEYKVMREAGEVVRKSVMEKCFGGETKVFKDKEGKRRRVGSGLKSLLKRGVYLVPVTMVEDVQNLIEDLIPRYQAAVARLCEVYEIRKEESRVRLGPQFNPNDYPSVEKVRRLCYVEYSYMSVGVPQQLESVKSSLFAQEKAKAKAKWAEATEEIRLVLRAGLKELVDHMLERLAPGDDGKKRKSLHKTAVSRLKSFLDDFNGKDLTNDSELQELVEKARQATSGKTIDDLRKDDGIRSDLSEKLSEIKSSLDELVMDVPERAILLED